MTYVITEPCVDVLDRACIEECPVDCIYEGERMLYIHPDECVDCGACEPVCPVEAIFYEDDVPEQWKDYYKANVEFFEDLGSPGGASKLGKIEKDHPLVAALPPRSVMAAIHTMAMSATSSAYSTSDAPRSSSLTRASNQVRTNVYRVIMDNQSSPARRVLRRSQKQHGVCGYPGQIGPSASLLDAAVG